MLYFIISDTSPMSSRNFPASFWNSNYHSHHSTSQVYHPDTMYHHHGTAGNPADPWQTHYQQYTAAAAHHHHRYFLRFYLHTLDIILLIRCFIDYSLEFYDKRCFINQFKLVDLI